jgi:hypothetical protein
MINKHIRRFLWALLIFGLGVTWFIAIILVVCNISRIEDGKVVWYGLLSTPVKQWSYAQQGAFLVAISPLVCWLGGNILAMLGIIKPPKTETN